MLDANLKAQIQELFKQLVHPVSFIVNTDDQHPQMADMLNLLNEVAEQSSLLSVVEQHEPTERAPSFSITREGTDIGIRFAVIPMGHEFSTLILAVLQVSGHPPKIEAADIERIQSLSGDFNFETFISLSCHNCPVVAQALNLMALLNPRIRHTLIDGALFQEEVEARNILAVPTLMLNGQEFAQGRMDLDEILKLLDGTSEDDIAAKFNALPPFEVLIVGGGPAGAAAAIYSARKGIRTGIVAERFGGQIMDTLAIENFISVRSTEGPALARALEEHVKDYEVDIFKQQRVTRIEPGQLHTVHLQNGATLQTRSLILATGARWREMNVPGETTFRSKGVAYCPHCDGPLFKGKRVAVVGGGNSGVEAAIDLAGIVEHVSLIEFDTTLRADTVLQQKLHSLPNVTVILGAQTTNVSGSDKVDGLDYTDRSSGESHHLALAGIFVQIGLLPNTDFLKDTVERNTRGEIVVDARGETSVPGILAAGDCTNGPYKQIIIAMGDGAKASLSAFDHLIRTSTNVS